MRKKTLFFRKLTDRVVSMLAGIAVFLAVGMMLWILAAVAQRGFAAWSPAFFTNPSKPYGIPDGGIANALLGTIFITIMATIIAVPPAFLGGVYLAEFRDNRTIVAILRFAANVMMGIPSVIVGLFVYVIMVVPSGHFSGLAASVALAIIMFPVVMRTSEDMLSMVPFGLREAALALGMSRTRTTLHIVCRTARKGLLTGILLSLARVSGETAPLLFTAMYSDSWPTNFFSGPTASMPVLITEYSTNSPFEAMHQMGWGAALVVTMLVLAINLGTRILFREDRHEH